MINLETFFRLHFDSKEISDDNIKMFTQDHIQRLIANNTSNQYTQLIKDTVAAYDAYFGAITDEDTAQALQEGRTITVNNLMEQFKDTVSQKEGTIRGLYGVDSAIYQEFFPQGVTEYRDADKGNIETLMDRMVNASTAHVSDLGQPFVDLFEQLRTDYTTARNAQLNQIGIVASDKSETSQSRDAVEIQLGKNVLTLALEFLGDATKANMFFDQSIIPKTSSGGGEGPVPPALVTFLTAVTKQNVLQGFNIGIRGFAGDEVSILWGDGTTSDITLDGTTQNTAHSYLTPGIYNIELKGSHPERIIEALITHAALTSALPADNLTALEVLNLEYNPLINYVQPGTLTALNYVSFFQCALNVTSINNILQVVNGYNTSPTGASMLLHGGTNASPTGQGNAAKNQLESRGWAVATN